MQQKCSQINIAGIVNQKMCFFETNNDEIYKLSALLLNYAKDF